MWIFRRKRGHIGLEALSEYLDGRLGASSRRAMELHLETCSRCNEELESLQHTVSLLKQAPAVAPRRSFFIEEAVAAPEPPRRIMVPAWGYGAAASMAVVIFAVILSADLGGLLSEEVSPPKLPGEPAAVSALPSPTPQPTTVPEVERGAALTTEAAPVTEAREEGVSEIAADASAEISEAVAVAEPTSVPEPAAEPVETEAMAAAAAAPAPPTDAEDAALGVESSREVEEFAASTPSPEVAAAAPRAEAAEAEMPIEQDGLQEVAKAEEIVEAEAVTPPDALLPTPAPSEVDESEVEVSPERTLIPTPTAAPTPTLTPEPSPTPTVFPTHTPKPAPTVSVEEREASAAASTVAEEQKGPALLPVEPADVGTAVVWRVLEGVLAGVALALIGGALWRVWSRRRRGA